MTAPAQRPTSPSPVSLQAPANRVRALWADRILGLPVWVVVTQVFLGLGWLRAAPEKLISEAWWRGDVIKAFLAEHEAQTLGWYLIVDTL